MPTRKQEKQIRDVMTLRQLAMSAILAESARDMSILTASEALSKLQRDKYAVATAEGVTEKIYQNYVKDLNRGGTTCIERVVKDIGDGKVKVTTSRAFVPWLNDMTKRESAEIITLLGDAERNGVYPISAAKELKKYFIDTNHNAMTAARTEAAKIRNDARSQSFIDSGVKYVEYVTAGDELVRPEHAMRNGKIYRHEDAPWIGEYNCRCLLVPADYKVEDKGATVTPNDAEILDVAALTPKATAPTQSVPADAARGQQQTVRETPAEIESRPLTDYSGMKTMQEIIDGLKNDFGEHITVTNTFAKLNPEAVAPGLAHMTQVLRDFPAIRGILTDVATLNKKGVYAHIRSWGDNIEFALNGKTYGQTGRELTDARLWYQFTAADRTLSDGTVIEHFHPVGTTFDDTPVHEMAHVVERALARKTYPNAYERVSALKKHKIAESIFKSAKQELTREGVSLPANRLIRADLSQYATKNYSETMAEAFADFYANGENAKPISRKIVEITKRKYSEVYQ